MANKNRRIATKVEIVGTNTAMTSGVGRYKFNGAPFDLQTLLQNLAGQGEEVIITKATVRGRLTHDLATGYHFATMAVMVSDQAIAGADPGENSNTGIVDDDIDVMTSGDYEFSIVSQRLSKTPPYANVHESIWNVDITDAVRKAAKLLARSATLSTNPYISVVLTGIASTTNTSIYFRGYLILEYSIAQRPLRML